MLLVFSTHKSGTLTMNLAILNVFTWLTIHSNQMCAINCVIISASIYENQLYIRISLAMVNSSTKKLLSHVLRRYYPATDYGAQLCMRVFWMRMREEGNRENRSYRTYFTAESREVSMKVNKEDSRFRNTEYLHIILTHSPICWSVCEQ